EVVERILVFKVHGADEVVHGRAGDHVGRAVLFHGEALLFGGRLEFFLIERLRGGQAVEQVGGGVQKRLETLARGRGDRENAREGQRLAQTGDVLLRAGEVCLVGGDEHGTV